MRTRPSMTVCTASGTERGTPIALAKSLPVPAGMMPNVASVRAHALSPRWAMPSPPITITESPGRAAWATARVRLRASSKDDDRTI